MHRLTFLGALFLACTAPSEPTKPAAPTAPPTPTAVTPPVAPTPPTPPVAPVAPIPPTSPVAPTPPTPPAAPATPPPPLAGHRDIHPRGGDMCLEMYSACSPDPNGGQRCTSAPYHLDCGQTGQVPNGGDKVRCVCP